MSNDEEQFTTLCNFYSRPASRMNPQIQVNIKNSFTKFKPDVKLKRTTYSKSPQISDYAEIENNMNTISHSTTKISKNPTGKFYADAYNKICGRYWYPGLTGTVSSERQTSQRSTSRSISSKSYQRKTTTSQKQSRDYYQEYLTIEQNANKANQTIRQTASCYEHFRYKINSRSKINLYKSKNQTQIQSAVSKAIITQEQLRPKTVLDFVERPQKNNADLIKNDYQQDLLQRTNETLKVLKNRSQLNIVKKKITQEFQAAKKVEKKTLLMKQLEQQRERTRGMDFNDAARISQQLLARPMLTDRSLSKEKIQENMNYLMMINSNKTVSENHLEQIAQALERMNCIKEPLLKELPIVKQIKLMEINRQFWDNTDTLRQVNDFK